MNNLLYFPNSTFWNYYLCCLEEQNNRLRKQVKELLEQIEEEPAHEGDHCELVRRIDEIPPCEGDDADEILRALAPHVKRLKDMIRRHHDIPTPPPSSYMAAETQHNLDELIHDIEEVGKFLGKTFDEELDMSSSASSLKSQLDTESSAKKELEKQLEIKEGEFKILTARNIDLQHASELTAKTLEECLQSVTSISDADKKQISILSANLDTCDKGLRECKTQLEPLTAEISSYKAKLKEREKVIKLLEAKLSTCKIKNVGIVKQVSDLRAQKQRLLQELETTRASGNESRNKTTTCEKHVDRLEKKLREVNAKYTQLANSLTTENMSEEFNKKSPLEKIGILYTKIQSQESELARVRAHLSSCETKRKKAMKDITDKDEQLLELTKSAADTLTALQELVVDQTGIQGVLQQLKSNKLVLDSVVTKLKDMYINTTGDPSKPSTTTDPNKLADAISTLIEDYKQQLANYDRDHQDLQEQLTYLQDTQDVIRQTKFLDMIQHMLTEVQRTIQRETHEATFSLESVLKRILASNRIYDSVKNSVTQVVTEILKKRLAEAQEEAERLQKLKDSEEGELTDYKSKLEEQLSLITILRDHEQKILESLKNVVDAESFGKWLRDLFHEVPRIQGLDDEVTDLQDSLAWQEQLLKKVYENVDKNEAERGDAQILNDSILKMLSEFKNTPDDTVSQTVSKLESNIADLHRRLRAAMQKSDITNLHKRLKRLEDNLTADRQLYTLIQDKLKVGTKGEILGKIVDLKIDLEQAGSTMSNCQKNLDELVSQEERLKKVLDIAYDSKLDVDHIETEYTKLKRDIKTCRQELEVQKGKFSSRASEYEENLKKAERLYSAAIDEASQQHVQAIEVQQRKTAAAEAATIAAKEEFQGQVDLCNTHIVHIIAVMDKISQGVEVNISKFDPPLPQPVITALTTVIDRQSQLKALEDLKVRLEAEKVGLVETHATDLRKAVSRCREDYDEKLRDLKDEVDELKEANSTIQAELDKCREMQQNAVSEQIQSLERELEDVRRQLADCLSQKSSSGQPSVNVVDVTNCLEALKWAVKLRLELEPKLTNAKSLTVHKVTPKNELTNRIEEVQDYFNKLGSASDTFRSTAVNITVGDVQRKKDIAIDKCRTLIDEYSRLVTDYFSNNKYTIMSDMLMDLSEDLLGQVRVYVRIKAKPSSEDKDLVHPADQTIVRGKCDKKTYSKGRFFAVYPGDFTTWQVFTGRTDIERDNDFTQLESHDYTQATGTPPMFNVLRQLSSGYHIIMFGYGMSGSGKTHTLVGAPPNYPKGVIHYCFQYLRATRDAKQIRVKNIFEEYVNLNNFDLLNLSLSGKLILLHGADDDRPKYKDGSDINDSLNCINGACCVDERDTFLRETGLQSVLDDVDVSDDNSGLNLILQRIEEYRTRPYRGRQRPTRMNKRGSSRSHLYILFEVIFNNGITGYITFIDAAGRESPMQIWNDMVVDFTGSNLTAKEKRNAPVVSDQEMNILNLADFSILLRQGGIDEYVKGRLKQSVESILKEIQESIYINESLNHLTHYLRTRSRRDARFQLVTAFNRDTYKVPASNVYFKSPEENTTPIMMTHILRYLTEVGNPEKTKYVMVCAVRQEQRYCNGTVTTLDFANRIKST